MRTPGPIYDFANQADYARAVDLSVDIGNNDLQHGQVMLANDSRFNQAFFSQGLTDYAVGGWNGTDINREVQAIFGMPVPVPRRFSHKVWDNAEAFASDPNEDIRAVGGDFQAVRLITTEVERKTLNRGLIYVIDMDEITDINVEEQSAAMYLTNRLLLNSLRRGIALLDAAGTNTARTWNSSSNPDSDLRTTLRTAADVSGLRPNNMVIGDAAWDIRWGAYAAQATAGAFGGVPLTAEGLAAQLGLDRVFISKARFASAAAVRTGVVASKIWSYYTSMSGRREDPSNIKRFFSPTMGGGPIRVFRQQVSEKKIIIGVEHYELIAITYSGGIREETVAAA